MSLDASDLPPSGGKLDAAAASLHADVTHLDFLLHSLADKLSAVPGLDPVIKYHRSRLSKLVGDLPYINDLHSKSSKIQSIQINIGSSAYVLSATESTITCSVELQSSKGARTSEFESFSEWIKQLMAAIDKRNRITQESLNALQDLIIYDRVQ